MSIFDHIFFFSLLFFIFFIITKFDQKYINRNYWVLLFIPVILYSLIIGCRYGWGNDYFWYKFRIENPNAYKEEEFGFKAINIFLQYIGINYVGAYIIYSFIFILSGLTLIKDYKFNKYMIALFLPATLILETFTIRQSLSTSFIFLTLHFLNKKELKYAILTICISLLIHGGNLIVLIPIITSLLISQYYPQKLLPWKITIPIYILFALAAEVFNKYAFMGINDIISSASLDNRYQGYLDNSAFWFSQEGSESKYEQGSLTLILSMLFHISIIYLCYNYIQKSLNKKNHITYLYNCIVISLLLVRLFFTYEILRRIAETIFQFYFIPLGYSLYMHFHAKMRKKQIIKTLCNISVSCIILYIILFYGRFILQSPTYKFVWNI